jgi:hypothetical protein
LLSGSHAGQTARLWDTGTAKEVWRFHCRGPNYSVAFSPDGDTALVSDDSLVRLVEVESGKEIASTAPSPGQVKCAAFSPCGRFVVSGESNGTIQVWDAKSGRQTRRFAGHRAAVRTVQFLPDGRHIISGSEDKTLRLWEVQTGQEVARFEAESCCTTHVTVSPDGRYAASGGGRYQKGDGEVVKEDQYDIHLWRLPESVWPKDVTGISEEPAEAARPEEKGMYDRLRTEAAELLGIEVEAEKEEQEQP